MLKDRAQKASALRLCVSKRWLPYLEVEVQPEQSLEKSRSLLTDVDVLAIASSPIGQSTRLVFDCKSGVRESAIGRAFWLRGVMTRANVAHGFIVMNDKVTITRDHRTSAADLSVTLLHENEFESLAQGMGGSTQHSIDSATAEIECWENFMAIGSQFHSLSGYLQFSRSSFWMTKDPGEQCRKLVARLRAIRSELDPEKRSHQAIFGDALSLFLYSLSVIANRLFLVLLRPASQEEFSSSLLALLYGGYENLEAAVKIRRITSGAAADDDVSIFPELSKLEHLVREILQAPQQCLHAALLAREMAFASLAGVDSTPLLAAVSREAPYAPKYLLLASEYLHRAIRLPPELTTRVTEIAAALLSTANRSNPDKTSQTNLF